MLNKKQNKISIAFVVKANKRIGYGHLVRCRTLAKKFQRMINCNIKFFSKISLNEISNFDICITDLPDINEEQLNQIKKHIKLLVSIDDGHKIKFPSDILINPNINLGIKHRFSKETKYISGKDYIILGEEFEKFTKETRTISKNLKQIFVCFGGSDSYNLTEKLIRALKEINLDERIKINLILGPLFGDTKRIERLIKSDSQFILHKNTSNLTKILWQSDLAIISGGTLMYEACVLGIPAMIICQNQEQNREAEFFEKKGVVINLGVFNKLANKKIKNMVSMLLNDLNLRKRMSKKAQKLINPRGAKRIVRIILKEFNKRKCV